MEDDNNDKSSRKGDQSDSKSIDSSGSTEDEDEVISPRPVTHCICEILLLHGCCHPLIDSRVLRDFVLVSADGCVSHYIYILPPFIFYVSINMHACINERFVLKCFCCLSLSP